MNQNTKRALITVVGVVVVVGGLLMIPSESPREDTQLSPEGTTETQTGNGDVEADSESSSVGFRIETVSIESCGTTCRDVTSTLYNTGDADAHNVEVSTKIYSGGDLIWEGSKRIGDLEAGESYTQTQEVDVGFGGGMKIRSNDGLITIETKIESDEKTVVFTEERDVA
ncbi:hypothetical protein ACEU6E_09790 [Halorutilales archaeon Cl-col2-1]